MCTKRFRTDTGLPGKLRAKVMLVLSGEGPGHFSQRLKLEALCPLADHACSAPYSQPCGARSSSTGFLKFSL